MGAVVLLMQPSHMRPVGEGSDHMWTLLPALDAHFRSLKKVVHGVMHARVRGGQSADGGNPGA